MLVGPMRTPERSVELTQVTEWEDGNARTVQDSLAAEEPLEIRIGDTPLTVTMRTPGHDLELAAGFLFTEGIIEAGDQIAEIFPVRLKSSPGSNVVRVELRNASFNAEDLQRNFFAASSCGICGKASIEAIRRRGLRGPNPDFHVAPELLCQLPEAACAARGYWAAQRRGQDCRMGFARRASSAFKPCVAGQRKGRI